MVYLSVLSLKRATSASPSLRDHRVLFYPSGRGLLMLREPWSFSFGARRSLYAMAYVAGWSYMIAMSNGRLRATYIPRRGVGGARG
jgi:hypothetical protein